MTLDLDDLMDFAARTTEGAGRVTLSYFGSAAVTFKGDGTELTAADTASEEFIRSAIAERYPEHGVFGEEGARAQTRGAYRWIIDPIDGTRSFAAGVPLYGILLALEKDGTPVLGCCHFPALSQTVVAAAGAGCWSGGRRVRVSDCDRIEDARIVTSGLEYWRDWATPPGREGFERLVARGRFTRTWGDCYGYVLIATGRAEIMVDPASGAIWDYMPLLPIVTEAGGRFSTLRDDPVRAWTTALASNGKLHAAAAACWAGARDEDIQTPLVRSRAGA